MRKNDVLSNGEKILRILTVESDRCLVIDCEKKTMPYWMKKDKLKGFVQTEYRLSDRNLNEQEKAVMNKRFAVILNILPYIADVTKRNKAITNASIEYGISKQTVRRYLCEYLVYQNIEALAPKEKVVKEKVLSDYQKNIRWALNKYYYTYEQNSLKTAYTMMLKEKYCDEEGRLKEKYPSFYQFRYYYRQHNSRQNEIISRKGLKYYQRNERPCTGDGVQAYSGSIGVGMLDATVCDIYLVNESGDVVGRPILTACVDGYSGICCGYSLTWEGGVYSLRNLMMNVISDKVEHCRGFGISIEKEQWPCDSLPIKFVTDKGKEYTSETFAQLAELGITITNLPPYRPDLKGPVEKFFDIIQGYFKPYLKGKGLIEPDFQERGAHDYRKDACLTMNDFEKILLHCIIYYNSQRILENFPYTEEMLKAEIKPYASCIWKWGMKSVGNQLINISMEELIFTLLPRTEGKFTRFGLKVNRMRYHNENYNAKYLEGDSATVAYNPDDISYVWLYTNGKYERFELIESRFQGKNLDEVHDMQKRQKQIIYREKKSEIESEISLARHIEVITQLSDKSEKNLKNIRETRKKESRKRHKDVIKEVKIDG